MHLEGKQVQYVEVEGRQEGLVYCGTFGDGLFRSLGEASSWQLCEGVRHSKIMSVAVSHADCSEDAGVVYAGTEPSVIFRSSDRGETWRELPTFLNLPSAGEWSFPPRPETHHVRFIQPDPHLSLRLYAAIEAGALLRSDDAGQTWRDRVPGGPLDTHTLAVHANAPGRLYSAAGDGYFESLDSGETWQRIEDGLQHRYGWSVAVDLADPDTILLTSSENPHKAHVKADADSFVYRRTKASSWRQVRDGLPDSQGCRAAVVKSSPFEPNIFYLAAEGNLYCSSDSGTSWQQLRIDWKGGQRPEHALSIAIAEAG